MMKKYYYSHSDGERTIQVSFLVVNLSIVFITYCLKVEIITPKTNRPRNVNAHFVAMFVFQLPQRFSRPLVNFRSTFGTRFTRQYYHSLKEKQKNPSALFILLSHWLPIISTLRYSAALYYFHLSHLQNASLSE